MRKQKRGAVQCGAVFSNTYLAGFPHNESLTTHIPGGRFTGPKPKNCMYTNIICIYIYMMYCIQICLFLRWNQNTVAAFSPSFMCCFCHLSWCPSMMQKSWRVHHVSVYVISVPCSEHALSATVSKCRRARLHSSARAQPSQWQKLRENGPQSNPNN